MEESVQWESHIFFFSFVMERVILWFRLISNDMILCTMLDKMIKSHIFSFSFSPFYLVHVHLFVFTIWFSLFVLVCRCSVASTQMRTHIHIVSNKRNKNNTCEMHPPRPKPSKNWWKVNAATRGLIVFGLSEAPREMPIIMECTTIPNSKTYTQNFVQTFLCFKEVPYIFLNKVINTREKKNSYIGFWNWLKIYSS